MGIWSHATKANPCPICGKFDWCTFGNKAMLCQRVESNRPHAKGSGWYHFYNDDKPDYIPKAKPPPRSINARAIIDRYLNTTPPERLDLCANKLGVTVDSLNALEVSWSAEKKAWAFPMSDGCGKVIGIRLRNDEGFKWAETGSRQGIFLPWLHLEPQRIVFLPEGPTDTAALLSMGLYAIGRPTCMSGNEQIAEALKRLRIFRAVIVADNDDMKKLGPREGRPGIEGAIKLKRDLKIPSAIWIPPSPMKDVREYYRNGGTRRLIESDIKNKVWRKE